MKIRIYAQDAEPFSAGGGSPLTPTRCEITANLNSDWTLTLEHPLDADGIYKLIQSGAVLRVPAFNGSQLYRIITADRTDSGITATAEPIFMDALHDVFFLDKRPTNLSGQDALDYLMSGTKFSGESDILNLNTAYYVRKNLIEALNGEDENAFTQRWGGEILFDNYKAIINQSAGRDKGVVVKYGRNLTGITETVDRSSLITRIIPVGYDGIMLDGDAPWVDSPLINSYPIIYNSVIEYSDVKVKENPDDPDEDGFATLAEAQAELTRLANLEYSQNNVDKELVSMDVDLILLQNTLEYAEFKDLEDISLGDTVKCEHSKLDISTSARCISLTWDCITQRVTAVTLGQFKSNYFNTMTSTTNRVDQAITPSGTVVAEKVQGILNAALTQLKLQNTVAQKQNVRAVLFEDLDPDSLTYGAMSIGTQGFQIANERTADGLDWNWRTAATAEGIFADVISAGILQGVEIRADKGTIGGWTIIPSGLECIFSRPDGAGTKTTKTILGSTENTDGIILISDSDNAITQKPDLLINDDGDYEAPQGTVDVKRGKFSEGVMIAPVGQGIDNTSTGKENGAIAHYVRFQTDANESEIAVRHMRLTSGTLIPDDGEYAPAVINPTVNYAWQLGSYGLRFKYGYFYTVYANVAKIEGTATADRVSVKYNVNAQSVDATDISCDTLSYMKLVQRSDVRFKKDVQTLAQTQSMDFIMALRPVSFKFIDDTNAETHSGFIAQEIADAQSKIGVDITTQMRTDQSSAFSDGSSDPVLGIDITAIIAPLVSVVQSQQAEIEQLKQKLSELEAKIN